MSTWGYKVVRGTNVYPVHTLDGVAEALVTARMHDEKFRAVARTSGTQERELTAPERSYVVATASERILAKELADA